MTNDYNKLTHEEIGLLIDQIVEGMRTINGDTAPIKMTARQASILIWSFKNQRKPSATIDVFEDLNR